MGLGYTKHDFYRKPDNTETSRSRRRRKWAQTRQTEQLRNAVSETDDLCDEPSDEAKIQKGYNVIVGTGVNNYEDTSDSCVDLNLNVANDAIEAVRDQSEDISTIDGVPINKR